MSTPDETLAQIASHAPPGAEVPALLRDLVAWGATNGDGLGYFQFDGARLDDHYIEDGSRRAHAFFSFLRTSDGSMIGWWRPDGQALADANVVVLGTGGDQTVLGTGLEDFLARWAVSGVPGVYDLAPEPEEDGYAANVAARARLRAWLEARGVRCDGERPPLDERSEALQAWFTSWSEERLRFAASDPNRLAMAAALPDVIGLPDEDWKRTFADAIVTATQCQLFGDLVGQQPLAVSPALEAALRAFRDGDAAELPDAGLWYRATLTLDGASVLTVQRSYLDLPNPNEIRLDVAGVAQDLARKPRAPYWTPRWLAP